MLALLLGATFSQEFSVQAPAGPQRGPQYQGQTALSAFDGGILACWYDNRAGTAEIYSTPVYLDGGVASTTGFEVVRAAADTPGLACSNTQCLLAWDHVAESDWEIGQAIASRVHAMRIGFDGKPIDGQEIDVGPSTYYSGFSHPAVASDGTDFLILRVDRSAGSLRVHSDVVSADGAVTPGVALPTSMGVADQWYPTVSWNGTAYLASWSETGSRVIGTTLFAPDGSMIADAGFRVGLDGGDSSSSASACGPSGCLIAWAQPFANEVMGMRVGTDGTPIDPQPFVLTSGGSQSSVLTTIAEGNGFRFAHRSSGPMTTGFVDADGGVTLVPPPANVADAGIYYPALASSGGRTLLTFNELYGGTSDVGLSWLSADGTSFLDREQVLPMLGSSQRSPAVAKVPGGHVLVWDDARDGDHDLRAAFLSPQTGMVPEDGWPLGVGNVSPGTLEAVPCGDEVLVAWDTSVGGDRIQGLRLRQDGSPIGPPFVIGTHPTAVQGPTLASSPEQCLVTWSDYSSYWDVKAVRFANDGGLLDATPLVVAGGGGSQYLPSAAWDGTGFVIAWANGTGLAISTVNMRRVELDGGMSDAGVPFAKTARSHVRVACHDDGTCLALWADTTAGIPSLRVGRLDPHSGELTPDGGMLLAQTPGDLTIHAARVNASAQSGGFDVAYEIATDAGTGVRIAHVYALGPEVRGVENLPGESASRLADPALASGRPGELLIAYTAADAPPGDGARQVRARYFVDRPLGEPCATADECASGECVDGVCCDTACGGGNASDCQACSAASGSSAADGTCALLRAGFVCRASANACDIAEQCSGMEATCPADTLAADGSPCEGGACRAATCEPREDAPTPGPAKAQYVVGCACDSSGAPGSLFVWALAVLLIARARRTRTQRGARLFAR